MSGFGPSTAFAATDRQVLKWNGAAWSTILSTEPEVEISDLWTSGTGGEGILFVLGVTAEGAARVRRYDGASWSDLPELGPSCPSARPLRGWASSPGDVYVVGTGVASRFDGSGWSPILACDGQYVSVWGTSSRDVWIAESLPFTGQSRLYHAWRGYDWEIPDSLVMDGSGLLLGTAGDDIFLGSSLYFDGRRWGPIQGASISGQPVFALPSRLLTVGARDGTSGLGQFVRTRLWNERSGEVRALAGSDADCSDGVDNDGDGLVDRGDSECVRAR